MALAASSCCACALSSTSPLSHRLAHLQPLRPRPAAIARNRVAFQPPSALFGGNTSGEDKDKDKKKFITKEEEPDQYWQTEAEKKGKGPMSTVLPYIVIFGFLTPFIILAVAFANGWVKMPVR